MQHVHGTSVWFLPWRSNRHFFRNTVLPSPEGSSSLQTETHWGCQTRVPAQDIILFCSTFVYKKTANQNNKTAKQTIKKTAHKRNPHAGIPSSSWALNSAGDRSQELLFFTLSPIYLPLMVWLCHSGCPRHTFSLSLAPKAAEVPAEGSQESKPTADVQLGSGVDAKRPPRGGRVWRAYFWSSPGVWAVQAGAVAGRQTHARLWVRKREFGTAGLSLCLYPR